MTKADIPPSQADFLALIRQLVAQISAICEQQGMDQHDAGDSHFHRLLHVAHRLEAFCQSAERGEMPDQLKMWHDLRNMIGIIMGYSELIQEGIPNPDRDTRSLFNQVLQLCNQILQLDEIDPSDEQSIIEAKVSAQAANSGTILVVDDQAESRDILLRYLQQDDHAVLEAQDGNEMFQVLDQTDVDLILLDLILPEMDGYQLLQRLKADEQQRAIPVIVVSGNKDAERVIRCVEAGAEDYLFKPFNPVLLRARINAGVERKRWHDKEQQYREELERNQRFIRGVFGRYLSEEVVSTLLENHDGLDLGGVQRKVSVLMADIIGFTTMAEHLPPHRVVRLLNNYLGTMSDIIMSHNGTVDEFIGDAILAIFGAPISRVDDTDRAIRCALDMQASIDEINAKNRAEDLPEIEMGISINTGLVVAGNIGSEKRAKYGVVGHTVNQTARIEEHCTAGSILISEATLEDAQSILSIGNSKVIQAKGILQAIKIFELTDISPDLKKTSAAEKQLAD